MQNAEREEESGNPAEAMAVREEHWAGSTWATTPEERAPRARTRALKLTIFEAVDVWNNDFCQELTRKRSTAGFGEIQSAPYMHFWMNHRDPRDNSNHVQEERNMSLSIPIVWW